MDLFEYAKSKTLDRESPLASRLRPTTLDEVVGQEHIVGKDKLLYRAIKADKLTSVIFYGPPGTGKTTLAKVIALAIDGKMLDSVQLSQKIGQLGVEGKSSIAFVIGGSLGLGDKVLDRADFKLSFSRMTFPHQLMQMILLEQIYRGYRILNHEPYHK